MNTEKTNDNKNKTADSDFGCNPDDFKAMFKMMGEWCTNKGRFPDCATMIKTMVSNFSKTENNKQ